MAQVSSLVRRKWEESARGRRERREQELVDRQGSAWEAKTSLPSLIQECPSPALDEAFQGNLRCLFFFFFFLSFLGLHLQHMEVPRIGV